MISTANNESVTVKAAVSGGDQVRVILYDGDTVAAEAVGEVVNGEATVHLRVSKPRLWDSEHTTYYGKAVAVIRAGNICGKIQVKVSAPGVKEQFVELDVLD